MKLYSHDRKWFKDVQFSREILIYFGSFWKLFNLSEYIWLQVVGYSKFWMLQLYYMQ